MYHYKTHELWGSSKLQDEAQIMVIDFKLGTGVEYTKHRWHME